MRTVPLQKPGRSEQVVRTPTELLDAIKNRLSITDFDADLAASQENTVTRKFYSEEDNALVRPWKLGSGWNWLNPPYANLAPWTAKAATEAFGHGAQTVMLVPASVGANWWRDNVETAAYVAFLNGRITFVGHTTPYPKDLALLFYTPWGFTGTEIWNWRQEWN